MTGTDAFGGICPSCGYNRMMMRYGSEGIWAVDACPKCGFAYGSNDVTEEKGSQVWEVFLKAEGDILVKLGLPLTREGILAWVESLPEPDRSDLPKTVWDWSKTTDFKQYM